MKLQTKLSLNKIEHNLISHDSRILLLGSCFSENIGKKLQYFKFQVTQNPFGIFFNPIAIKRFITNIINQKEYLEEDIFFHQERWHSFDIHSNLSSTDKTLFLDNLNTIVTQTFKQIKDASHIVITLGTAWVYRHIQNDIIVANCHKIPQKEFLKELLSVNKISEILDAIVALLKSVNNSINVVFTISPVRHLKDGFIENTQSKAHLISALHQVVNPKRNTFYFPSYELMMDELRDYRFYAEDMIHPNKTAIDYIWEKFTETWFTEQTRMVLKKIDGIQKSLQHKAFNEDSEAHQKFKDKLEFQIKSLQKEFPFMQF